MRLFKNDTYFVEKIYAGEDQAFTTLYEKCRGKFYGHFRAQYSEDKFGNKSIIRYCEGGAYLDDLYQNTLLKLHNQIKTGKMFVDGGKIFVRGKDGTIKRLTASLETYIISVGRLTLKEMVRGECRYVSFDPIERISSEEDNDPKYDMRAILEPTVVTRVNVDPIFDISTDQELDNEQKFSIVREIVKELNTPCKEIFNYYFWEKKSLEEIAKLMPQYSNVDSVKNQKSRCHKKFKVAFAARMAVN